jgi:hypothetical protein
LAFAPGLYMGEAQVRRFYLNYRPSEELSFRFGKFQQAYGLMDQDHTTPIRRGLGWDEGTESYNLEAAWLGEKVNAYLTGNLGPLDSKVIPKDSKEKGLAFRLGIPFWDRFQVGGSYFHGTSNSFSRDVTGPFAVLGFTQRFFLVAEIDYQNIYGSMNPSQSGFVTWNKLDYEFIQGLHGLITYGQTQPHDSTMQSSAWGIGSNWYPRPHFDFEFLWQFQREPGFGSSSLDYVTLLLHYYL